MQVKEDSGQESLFRHHDANSSRRANQLGTRGTEAKRTVDMIHAPTFLYGP